MSVRTGGNHCSISAKCLYDYVQKSRVSTNVRSVLISVISASVSSVFPCLPVVGALVQRVQTQERKYTRSCMFCREDLFTNNISSYFHYPLPFIIITRYPLLSLPLTLSVNDNTCRNALILSVTRNPQLLRLLDNRRRFFWYFDDFLPQFRSSTTLGVVSACICTSILACLVFIFPRFVCTSLVTHSNS